MADEIVKYHTSITTISLRRYIDCLVHKNIYALVIEGKPSDEELNNAWLEIQSQYADATGDYEQKNYIELMKETTLLNVTYQQVQLCAKNLETCNNYLLSSQPGDGLHEKSIEGITYFAKKINEFTGSNFSFTDQETFYSNIKRCINRSKSIKIRYDLKFSQLKSVEEKFEAGKEPDEAYFFSILISLSDHAGYQLNDSITVFEYCERIKRLNDGRSNKRVHK